MSRRSSILDDLGEEVTGIISPVSICMLLTVVLVRVLNPDGDSDSGAVYIASAFYEESDDDSTGTKISGAVINALIFVGVVGFMTFVLVMLFKKGYTKFIYVYMGFAGFSIFFVLAGLIFLQLLQKADIHIDWISFTYMLYNFAMVGAVTLFFFPAPLLMKQCYLIITGVATAYVFTWIPEWTTWILLIAMALYDIIAVLLPGGPLKELVELAQERNEEIPALVYQARSTRREDDLQARITAMHRQQAAAAAAQQGNAGATNSNSTREGVPTLDGFEQPASSSPGSSLARDSPGMDAAPDTPLIQGQSSPSEGAGARPAAAARQGQSPMLHHQIEFGTETPQQPSLQNPPTGPTPNQPQQQQTQQGEDATPDDMSLSLPDAIKLGLGDFIFYSVLVGRAAMYDMLTVFACYLAIIAGLGCTLLWLAISHHALPALPISIALAVAFYFISRFVMEPVVLPMVLQLVYF